MVELIGIFFALIAAIVWGSGFVPLKLAGKVDDIQYSSFVAVGIFLSTIITMPFLNFSISFNVHGLISGVMWALANILSIASVKLIGLSRVAPIVGAGIILISFLWGVSFFNEKLISITFAIIGVLLLISGIPFIITNREEKTKNVIKGIVYSAIAGVIFGSYITPLKLSGLQISEYIFSMVSGILITTWIVYLLSLHIKKQKISFNKIIYSLSGGFSWTLGNITSLLTISSLGLSIGFPLTQLQLLVAVSWGIFYFREVRDRQIIVKIIFGAILLIVGAVLLALSK